MNESDLVSVAQAIEIIDSVALTPRIARVKLQDAQGLRLAQDVTSDRDYPPFDKSLMDGYAVRCDDVRSTPAELNVVGEIAAGSKAVGTLKPGEAFAIMTGAPIPDGADGVVPVEDTLPLPPGEGGGEGRGADDTSIQPKPSGPPALILTFCPHGDSSTRREKGQEQERIRVLRAEGPQRFITRRGADCAAGAVVLQRGTKLEAAQLAVAASVGASQVDVFAAPRVAVLSTGDELVPIDATPGPVQIRNSNNIMLVALLRRFGCDVTDLGSVRDDPDAIRRAVENGMQFDVLFVSGGMSMGRYDYVPKILLELGVELLITKLRIKPGKPFVFGVSRQPAAGSRQSEQSEESLPAARRPLPACFVFGLPGNPVSSFVCTMRLCSRLIGRMSGADTLDRWTRAALAGSVAANGAREFYQPAVLSCGAVKPLNWKGSADIYTLARANALIVRPENSPAVDEGQLVDVLEVPS